MLWPDGPFIPFTHEETEAHSLNRFTRQIFIEYCAWDTDLDSQLNKKSGNIQTDNCSKGKAEASLNNTIHRSICMYYIVKEIMPLEPTIPFTRTID